MTLVSLIVTGVSERLGLPSFLTKLFPEVEFAPLQVTSFTSSRIRPYCPTNTTAIPVIDKFASAIIASIDPGRNRPEGRVPDFVVAIDDLELCNIDQPDRVVDELSSAVRRGIQTAFPSTGRQEKCARRLVDAASFHLLCPMLEAYFFADPIAILRATERSIFEIVPEKDLEDFETCDTAYLQKHAHLPTSQAPVPMQPNTQEWFAKHPKEYLRHLSSDPQTGLAKYRESQHGSSALKQLSPLQALAIATQRRFLRSMVYDLADALNTQLPAEIVGDCHPVTSHQARSNRVLRNI